MYDGPSYFFESHLRFLVLDNRSDFSFYLCNGSTIFICTCKKKVCQVLKNTTQIQNMGKSHSQAFDPDWWNFLIKYLISIIYFISSNGSFSAFL